IVPKGVDTVVEVAPAANAAIDVAVLGRLGALAVYADDRDEFTLPVRKMMVANARWQFVLLYTAPNEAKEVAVEDIMAALYDEAVRVGAAAGLPLHHFSLDQARQAHAAVQDGAVGKVLIDVAEDDA
ncbi:MAG TPA: NADPH:quinone reductase, partial [Micromonosporaceae bacterium]